MKSVPSFLLMSFLLICFSGLGQITNSCSTASEIIPNNTCSLSTHTFATNHINVWLKFTAPSTSVTINLDSVQTPDPVAHIHTLQLYEGTCGGTLNLLEARDISTDQSLDIKATGLTIGAEYFVQIAREVPANCGPRCIVFPQNFDLCVFDASLAAGGPTSCAYTNPGQGAIQPADIDVDDNGNVFVTGKFSGTVTFVGGAISTTVGTTGTDMYVAKYFSNGDLDVGFGTGGIVTGNMTAGICEGLGLDYDDVNKVVYVVGRFFDGLADFGGASLLDPLMGGSAFIAKYDELDGSLIAIAQEATGSFSNLLVNKAADVIADQFGDVYVAGDYKGTTTIQGTSLNSTGNNEMFVAKYDSDLLPLWVTKSTSTVTGNCAVNEVAYDPILDQIITIGYFDQDITFESAASAQTLPLSSFNATQKGFLVAHSASGDAVWFEGVTSFSSTLEFSHVGVEPGTGDVYAWVQKAAGSADAVQTLVGTTFVTPLVLDVAANGFFMVFNPTASFSPATSRFDHFGDFFNPQDYILTGFRLDDNNRIFSTASFTGALNRTIEGDPFGTTQTFTAQGARDVILEVRSTAFTTLRAKVVAIGGSSIEMGSEMTLDNCLIYNTGTFSGTVDFEGNTLTSVGASDAFLHATSHPDDLLIYPLGGPFAAPLEFCDGESITLQSSLPGDWFIDGVPLATGTDVVTASVGGVYTVQVPTPCCTPATTAITVIVNPLPVANAGPDVTICEGETHQFLATGGGTYSWSPSTFLDDPNIADPLFSGAPVGTYAYSLDVTSPEGCSNAAPDMVDITVTPHNIDFSISSCPDIVSPTTFTDLSSLTGVVTYLWDFDDGGATSTLANPTYTFTSPGYHLVSLTVTDDCGTLSMEQLIYVYENQCACPPNTTYTFASDLVSGTATYDFATYDNASIEGEVRIENGAHLTIDPNVTLRFGPQGKIVVEPGGELTVNPGVTLTSLGGACNLMWQGIEVHGNGTAPSNSVFQGLVALNQATIENAHVGVRSAKVDFCAVDGTTPCPGPYAFEFGGGVVQADQCIFQNNGVDVAFLYKELDDASASFVRDCDFNGGSVLDPGYLSGNAYEYPNAGNPWFGPANQSQRSGLGILMWEVDDIALEGNHFSNAEVGMQSFDAKYDVVSSGTRFTEFSDLRYGIRIFNTYWSIDNRHLIEDCIFEDINDPFGLPAYDNTAGIQIEGGYYDEIRNNIFRSTSLIQSDFPNGVYLENARRFEVTGNQFNNLLNGIWGINSAGSGGYIGSSDDGTEKNQFLDCDEGIITDLSNQKLTLKCNQHEPTGASPYDVNWRNYDLLSNQGQVPSISIPFLATRYPAGNEFTVLGSQDIETVGDPYIYVHHDASPGDPVVPVNTTPDITVTPATGLVFDPIQSCKPRLKLVPFPGFAGALVQIDDTRSELADLQDELDNLVLDGGNTAFVLDELANAKNSGQLKDVLLGSSPLSAEVLIAYINSSVPTPGHFKQVLLENAPVPREVQPFLNVKLETLPPGIADQIKAVLVYNPDVRTPGGIQVEMEALEQDYVSLLTQLITEYVLADDIAGAIDALEDDGTTEALQELAGTYLFLQDAVEAANTINAVPGATQAELDWMELANIYLALLQTDRTLFELDATEVTTIADFTALMPNELAFTNAKAVDRLVNNTDYPLWVPLAARSAGYFTSETAPTKTEVSIYPNPASNRVYLALSELPEDDVYLEIYDATGSLVLHHTVYAQLADFDVSAFENGFYFVRVFSGSEELSSHKLVVNR